MFVPLAVDLPDLIVQSHRCSCGSEVTSLSPPIHLQRRGLCYALYFFTQRCDDAGSRSNNGRCIQSPLSETAPQIPLLQHHLQAFTFWSKTKNPNIPFSFVDAMIITKAEFLRKSEQDGPEFLKAMAAAAPTSDKFPVGVWFEGLNQTENAAWLELTFFPTNL